MRTGLWYPSYLLNSKDYSDIPNKPGIYTISNRKIVDFFISTDDPSGVTKDTTHLLKLGNLKQNDPKYKVEFVKAIKNPSVFTGVKIIPQ